MPMTLYKLLDELVYLKVSMREACKYSRSKEIKDNYSLDINHNFKI